MPQFYTLPTEIGQAKMANAIALGQTVNITHMAVGDGNGSLPTPDSDREALVNEVRRAPINTSDTDGENPSWIVVEQVVPPDVGGWTIREIGIFDEDGDLIGYGNYPETYKPVLSEGSGRTQTIRFVMEVSDTAAVTLKVDPSVVLATRKYTDDGDEKTAQDAAAALQQHAESRDHPAGTETAQGMLELASSAEALNGEDLMRAMSSARVREAFDQFGLGNSGAAKSKTLNDAKTAGQYRFTSSDPDTPETGASGPLLVLVNSSSAVIQIAVRNGSNKAWIRNYSGSSWGSWTRIVNEEDMPALLSTSGYQKMLSGIIFQWFVGPQISTEASEALSFPLTFPNRCFGAWIIQASGSNDARFTPSSIGEAGLTVNCYGQSGTPRILAIGH